MKPLVIYHGNCADGFTSAWLANRAYAEAHPRIDGTMPRDWVVDHHAGVYGDNPPDVTGRLVYILDFSYPPAVLGAMALAAEKIVVIDHHETAIRKFTETDWRCPDNVELHLDTTRSGAYLTSLYFWPDREPDEMVKLVDDRDRWVFQYNSTRPFAAGLFSRPYKIGEWNYANRNIHEIINDGAAIERKHHKDIEEMLAQTMFMGTTVMNGKVLKVACANLPYIYSSDAGHKMLEMWPHVDFAACWYQKTDGSLSFSLRSRKDGFNVAKLAEFYGGGGHPAAAGCTFTKFPFDRV